MAMKLNISQLYAAVKEKPISDDNLEQKKLSNRNAKLRKYQNIFLLVGALFFIVWRL